MNGSAPCLQGVGAGPFRVYPSVMELHPELRAAIDRGVHGHLVTINGDGSPQVTVISVSYTHLRAQETVLDLVCRLMLEKKKGTYPIQRNNILTDSK